MERAQIKSGFSKEWKFKLRSKAEHYVGVLGIGALWVVKSQVKPLQGE